MVIKAVLFTNDADESFGVVVGGNRHDGSELALRVKGRRVLYSSPSLALARGSVVLCFWISLRLRRIDPVVFLKSRDTSAARVWLCRLLADRITSCGCSRILGAACCVRANVGALTVI